MGAVLNSVCLPRKDLLTIYKSFVRHQVNYGDNLSDKPGNESRKTKQKKSNTKPAQQYLVEYKESQGKNFTMSQAERHKVKNAVTN